MHGIWKQEGMKQVREHQLRDQRKQREEKHWLEELEMETIKQKIEGQSTKDTEVALVVKIVTDEEYIELFGTEMMKHLMQIGVRLHWKIQRRHQRHKV